MVELCLVGDAVGCFESRLSHCVVTVFVDGRAVFGG